MANFVCDICGGTIKMQANRTGVCQGCGMEYDIEAIRAMAGRNKPADNKTENNSNIHQNTNKNELDRDAVLIHLNDVRILETIILQSVKAQDKLKAKENDKQAEITAFDKNTVYNMSEISRINNLIDNINRRQNKLLIVNGLVLALSIFFWYFIVIKQLLISLFAVLISISPMIIMMIYNKKCKKKYITELNDLQNQKEKFENNKRKEISYKQKQFNKWKIELNEERTIISTDLEVVKKELKKAYDLNIIPLQFRTIEGVYYLYDYMSTSQQSLSEALMQANLEAIKQRMDTIIENQSDQILLQAQANAKLEEINVKNQQILETAQATMNNTAIAAKYAQIAAINSEVTAQLTAKQLGYQRAEFWLN